MKLSVVFVLLVCSTLTSARPTSSAVDKVLDKLIKKLEVVKNQASYFERTQPCKRHRLALEAATNNWNDAMAIKMLSSSQVLNRLKNRYEHTKYWEHYFNVVVGGYEHTYAGECHGKAKIAYYEAYLECKELGKKIISGNVKMVSIFQNLYPIHGKIHWEKEITIKSGYSRQEKVEADLHTKIAAQVETSMDEFVAKEKASISAEIAAALKATIAIQNTAERIEKQKIVLDMTSPVYVYQVQYANVMADGSTLACWGAGWIVSTKPIV